MNIKKHIFCAIDYSEIKDAISKINIVKNEIGGIKLGLEFFVANGLQGVKRIKDFGLPIFLDLKLHDIPNTVLKAFNASSIVKPDYFSVHLTGGTEMLKKLKEIKDEIKIVGITMLTSLNSDNLRSFGIRLKPIEFVKHLVTVAKNSSVDAIVCSPLEIIEVKKILPNNVEIITPGIRISDHKINDQKRFLSPGKALKNGSDILIIGRPITESIDPIGAIKSIKEDIIKNLVIES